MYDLVAVTEGEILRGVLFEIEEELGAWLRRMPYNVLLYYHCHLHILFTSHSVATKAPWDLVDIPRFH
jgi:hypothetical protein